MKTSERLKAFDDAVAVLSRQHKAELEALEKEFEGKTSGDACIAVVRRYLDRREAIERKFDAAIDTAFQIARGTHE